MSIPKYEMTMNLNVLEHLGINLYSNIPAVLSETVANAWDADASKVWITINNKEIIIEDNGHGMDQDDVNNKFLTVGYRKRENQYSKTPKYGRDVMGRKGIGKLSLFSIANNIQVQTSKNGEQNCLLISSDKLREKILEGKEKYFPTEIECESREYKNGTKIILTDLKKRTNNTSTFLIKRLARRFSVLGQKYHFQVFVNGKEISIVDRDYFNKLEYMWVYTEDKGTNEYKEYCDEEKLTEYDDTRNTEVKVSNEIYNIRGWIGSVKNSGDLKDGKDNLNKIVVMVRGKLAMEDILEVFSEGGLYSKYLIGEIHADFLDLDDMDDIATSNRQSIIEDDPRYEELVNFLQQELKFIQSQWTKIRNIGGKNVAFKTPAIKEWYNDLGKDHQKKAEKLFGKINQITLDEDEKKSLFRNSVLAFESFKYKQNLDALDKISPENLEEFSKIIADFDDVEKTLYHQIVTERLKIINILQDKVEENALERILQKHLYEHLWLLDPSWDRATETPYMEKRMQSLFAGINADLSNEERKARFDIKYKKTSGKHVIIELKRSNVKISTYDLLKQVNKYGDALRKLLASANKDTEPYEIICILGQSLSDWTDEHSKERSINQLRESSTRVVLYNELIEDALRSYQKFLEMNKEAGRVTKLIESIDFQL